MLSFAPFCICFTSFNVVMQIQNTFSPLENDLREVESSWFTITNILSLIFVASQK